MAKKQAPAAVPPTGPEAASAGKGRLKLIIVIVVAMLVAVGLSVGGTLYFMGKGEGLDSDKTEEAQTAVPGKQPAIYEVLMPAFVVNFNYKGRQRYMQVSIALMTRDQAALDALKVHMPLLRNRLVMLLSSQDFEALRTPVGKEMLRQQATASVQELAQKEIGKLAIEQVLFTNFVLQ
ncbi:MULTISPECIES: flagellar basal body-associated protein FliL [Stutzerimonas stutzeri subgroup]|uniref:Flagellar protein FliL n=2 Tax=Gammaproteobacteria TaxID=1236 RepID=A0A2N8RJP9_STUST|nr:MULTISPECIES: flagellar basal body-associated protein FliL [Stutzerimonas stutzeri subgroup]KRW68118.1 flagellar basal body protein FliL [Pseudomonas sp. TTU2014-105ASC]MDH2241072.1 flagellar basal body-associated protein FliL [Pseudomonas sp. GD03909]MDH2245068.1 flagellar basal body-associated protein FliL [Pseudomonas sp. GD03856]MDH2263703.1 flagellar basal body-associated protein FliL [Pseudomonas sp. GD03855]EHY76213.1 flagellar basal body-associated protein FliL [Stutzerimonas stutze